MLINLYKQFGFKVHTKLNIFQQQLLDKYKIVSQAQYILPLIYMAECQMLFIIYIDIAIDIFNKLYW